MVKAVKTIFRFIIIDKRVKYYILDSKNDDKSYCGQFGISVTHRKNGGIKV